MTEKQKIAATLGTAMLVIAFAFIYQQFSMKGSSEEVFVPMPTVSSNRSGGQEVPTPLITEEVPIPVAIPTTSDNVVDKILSDNEDATALDRESNGEVDIVMQDIENIDTLTNEYDN